MAGVEHVIFPIITTKESGAPDSHSTLLVRELKFKSSDTSQYHANHVTPCL